MKPNTDIQENIEKLNQFAEFQPDWNGNGAQPLSSELLQRVKYILPLFANQPFLSPTANHSIQLEWDTNQYYIEMELYEDGTGKIFMEQ